MRIPLLILLVLAAGCADNAPVETGKTMDGIRILEFAPEKQDLWGGESTNLLLRIQNTGDATATAINATIVRSGDTKATALTQTVSDIEPPDEGFNQPGGVREVLWALATTETSVPKTQDITARIDFNYKSEATKEIPALTTSRARELYQAGNAPQAGISTNSFAPIRIMIQSKDPLELGEGQTKGNFTFKVYLTNEAGGAAEKEKASPAGMCKDEKLDCIDNLTITTTTNDAIECEDAEVLSAYSIRRSDLKLWQGKEAITDCRVFVDLGDTREKQIIIKATANYRYHYDASTAVQIEPKR